MEIHFETILKKFKNKAAHLANKPYETLRSKHSDLLDEGADELIKLILGIGGAVDFGETAYMGVGNGADAFDATDTDLQGASKTYKVVDAQPTLEADEKAQWVCTYTAALANHAWEEYTISNTADGTGDNLMRILAAKGTKVSPEVWELTIQEEFA